MQRLIPLEMSYDYPVDWNYQRIIRDLVQNFNDSIGRKNFYRDFIYETGEVSNYSFDLVMKCKGYPFSYEWLTFIGGSTKTDHPGEYVGMYGEGFKVCMLLLLRMGCDVTMESDVWKLKPCRYTTQIDNRSEKMLGYEYYDRKDDGWTILQIKNIKKSYYKVSEEAVLYFLYDENPLLGKRIAGNKSCEIFLRSRMQVPRYNGDVTPIKGLLFCNMLVRGALPFEAVIAIKKDMRTSDSRKREVLEDIEVKTILNGIAERISPKASYELLLLMKEYWNDMPKRLRDVDTWYYFICQLVRNVARSESYTNRFISQYDRLIYIERETCDAKENSIIREARSWYKAQEKYKDCQMVNPVFRYLGALSIVDDYKVQKEKGFRAPGEMEKKLIELLFLAYEEIFEYKAYDERPDVRICRPGIRYSQMQFMTKSSAEKRGLKNAISRIIIDEDALTKSFAEIFILFAEKIMLVYGTARSANNNVMMTELGCCIAKKLQTLEQYAAKWDEDRCR